MSTATSIHDLLDGLSVELNVGLIRLVSMKGRGIHLVMNLVRGVITSFGGRKVRVVDGRCREVDRGALRKFCVDIRSFGVRH